MEVIIVKKLVYLTFIYILSKKKRVSIVNSKLTNTILGKPRQSNLLPPQTKNYIKTSSIAYSDP